MSTAHLEQDFTPVSPTEHPELYPGSEGERALVNWENEYGPMESADDAARRLNATYGGTL